MSEKLVAAVLGNRNSGKSHTWNVLFDETVRTGKNQRKLWLNNCEFVEVFLVSGSPEEREEYVGNIITDDRPAIVLCSMQHHEHASSTIEYFRKNQYSMYVQRLNPGHSDSSRSSDELQMVSGLIESGATVCQRSGKEKDARPRVNEIRNFIYGWAAPRGLVHYDPEWA